MDNNVIEDYVDPFILAASTVLKEELNMALYKRELERETGAFESRDITAIIVIQGDLEGQVVLELSYATALDVVKVLTGGVDFNSSEAQSMILSGIAELANIIAGRATIFLEAVGKKSTVAPPAVLYKKNALIATVGINRYRIIFNSEIGDFVLRVGLRRRIGTV